MQLLEETGVQHLHIKPETYTYGGKKNETWLIIKTSLFVRNCCFKLLTLTWKTIVLLDKFSITEKVLEITAQASNLSKAKQLIPCVFHNIFTAAVLMLYLPINHIKAFPKTKPSITTSFSSFFTFSHKAGQQTWQTKLKYINTFFRTQYFSPDLSNSGCCWFCCRFCGVF